MKYFLIVTLLFAFLVCGCDSAERTVAISGTVTFNGEPLDDAILQIDKNDGSAPVFVKIVDGEFSGPVSYTHLPSPRDKRQSRMPSSA